jgi:hypothetical protein
MSELIKTREERENFHRKLMATASAFALSAYIASANVAQAEDHDRPTVWIELGGQMELMQGLADPITAPFMTAISPTPGPYSGNIFLNGQKPSRHAFGMEGAFSFQPENSDWIFSAGIRYGRSHSKRHIHNQTQVPPYHLTIGSSHATFTKYAAPFADTKSDNRESHAVLDFMAGKDVGLGLFGRDSSSTLNAGVRFAQFSSRSTLNVQARPSLIPYPFAPYPSLPKYFTWDQYSLAGSAERNFRGVGPSLSWSGSAGLLGNRDDGELMFDWSVNAAVLFGRQKAITSHHTMQRHEYGLNHTPEYPLIYQTGTGVVRARSRSVAIPNLGGSIGLSVKYPNAKVSFGYRADFFFGAMDTGIDRRHTKDLGFSGPFAAISIGLGG